jgi:hypothetical protein
VSECLALSLSLARSHRFICLHTYLSAKSASHGRFADKTTFVARTVRSGPGAAAAAGDGESSVVAGDGDGDRTAMDAHAMRAARSEYDDGCSGLRELVLSYNKGDVTCWVAATVFVSSFFVSAVFLFPFDHLSLSVGPYACVCSSINPPIRSPICPSVRLSVRSSVLRMCTRHMP